MTKLNFEDLVSSFDIDNTSTDLIEQLDKMAKLCSPYGTSPLSSFFNELSPNSFPDDFHHIQPDPFDFFEDGWMDGKSIFNDIKKIEDPNSVFTPYGSGMDVELDIKPEICNNDLMWSAVPPNSILSTSASSMSSDISQSAPLAAVQNIIHAKTEGGSTKQQQLQRVPPPPQPTVVTAKKINHKNIKQEIIKIKQEPTDDVEQQLEHHSIPNSKTVVAATATLHLTTTTKPTTTTTSMHNIPAGTSLLRKKPQQTRGTLHITKRGDQLLPSAASTSSALLSNSTSSNSAHYLRPETPHSLDDDCSTSEFRHNVDLRACVMGSNNISLTADPTHFIHNVSQELQDTSKKQIDTRLISECSLAEVLDVINNSVIQDASLTPPSSSSSTCSDGFNYLSVNTSDSMGSREFDSDEESTGGSSNCSLLDQDVTYGAGGVSPVSSQSSNISSTHHYMQHSDHSYTRCKDGIDDLSTNLETPSDSEEEIDVVSINDKKLPTNPSDKDRRALQTKVAHKFNSARIVKTPNGIRTIPPRRRGSYVFPYTPASSSPVKSVNNSRFPSPAATPFQNQYTTKYVQQQQQQQQMMTVVLTDSSTGTPMNVLSTSADKSRKRLLATATATTANVTIINGCADITSVTTMPPNKKHRGKKTKHLVTAVQLPNGILKRHYSVDETADTIEKRNLHNDMERQRRIGLKNLFESLKKQIPSIKDKERAPKVNILREAAKLCEALTREDQQLSEQKDKLKDEFRRKQELLAQLRAQQRD